jgi:hypothetical protein
MSSREGRLAALPSLFYLCRGCDLCLFNIPVGELVLLAGLLLGFTNRHCSTTACKMQSVSIAFCVAAMRVVGVTNFQWIHPQSIFLLVIIISIFHRLKHIPCSKNVQLYS